MVQETEKAKRLLLKYGEKKGSMSYSNVNPDADNTSLMELALGINELQLMPVKNVICISSTTLEKE